VNEVTKTISLLYSQLLIVRNSKIISNSTNEFKNKYPNANIEGVYSKFEIIDEASYSSETYKQLTSNLSLYTQMWVMKEGTSGLEAQFLQELDTHYNNYIKWVWHNG
jgi:trans-aconitate methyltransferase